MLDIMCNNAIVIYALNHVKDPQKLNAFDFTMKLGRDLLTPHLNRRSTIGLQKPITDKMKHAGYQPTNPSPTPGPSVSTLSMKFGEKSRRCSDCLQELKDAPSEKSGRPQTPNSAKKVRLERTNQSPTNPTTPKCRPKHKSPAGDARGMKKAAKDKLWKGMNQCQKCEHSLCMPHAVYICNDCFSKL